MKKVWYGNIVLPDRIIENGQITVENGRIAYVGYRNSNEKYSKDQTFEMNGGYIWPGLIDLHVHGAGGSDVMDGSNEALSTIASTLLRYGVTGFLATTITSNKEHLSEVLTAISNWLPIKGEAEILGVHLEGPWISPKYKGAQNPEYIQTPKKNDGNWAYNTSRGKLRVVTLAPEQPNAHEIIKELVDRDIIVSIGHTNASYEDVEKAVNLGATQITHTFNAMSGYHHREPGVALAAHNIDKLYCELIVDGLHVHPKAVELLLKVKGSEKIILISDSMRAVDMPDGEYDIGGLKVVTKEGKATLMDGTLAGSQLTLNRSIFNTMSFANVPIWEAVKMASLIPALRLGLDQEIGSIDVGKRANLVAVDYQGEIQSVWIDGSEKYSNN